MAKDGYLIIDVLGGDADLPLSGSVNISNYEIHQHILPWIVSSCSGTGWGSSDFYARAVVVWNTKFSSTKRTLTFELNQRNILMRTNKKKSFWCYLSPCPRCWVRPGVVPKCVLSSALHGHMPGLGGLGGSKIVWWHLQISSGIVISE